MENGSLLGKAKSGWNAFIFQEKFASTPCAARKIELTATRAKKRFIQEKKERFRREKARFWEIGEKKERNLALDFSPKMSPLTRESMKPLLFRSPTTVPCIHDQGTDVSGVPYQ